MSYFVSTHEKEGVRCIFYQVVQSRKA